MEDEGVHYDGESDDNASTGEHKYSPVMNRDPENSPEEGYRSLVKELSFCAITNADYKILPHAMVICPTQFLSSCGAGQRELTAKGHIWVTKRGPSRDEESRQ